MRALPGQRRRARDADPDLRDVRRQSASCARWRRTAFGQLVRTGACPTCGGAGQVPEQPCRECGGEGRTVRARTWEVEVPPGIESGQRIRISGAGPRRRGRRARAGDLYVEVVVAEDERFERHGQDLVAVVEVPATRAMLGGNGTVPTLDGEREVEIPAGAQPGEHVVLRGLGLPSLRGGPGATSTWCSTCTSRRKLTKEQRELVERLDESLGPDGGPRDGGSRCAPPRRAAVDPPRGPLPPGARRAGARRAGGACARRRRGGSRSRLGRVRDLRRAPASCPRCPSSRPRSGDGLVEVTSKEVPDDWADRWQDFHKAVPRRRAHRGCGLPGRTSSHPGSAAIDVVVDPGQAFGTGAHPTTRMCLEMLLELADAGHAQGPLADWGTGSGVLAIAGAKLGFGPSSRVTTSPLRSRRRRRTPRRTGFDLDLVRVDLRRDPAPTAPTIAANLTARLLREVAVSVQGRPERVVCSGMLTTEVDEVADAFAGSGLRERERRASGDWAALLLERPAGDRKASQSGPA